MAQNSLIEDIVYKIQNVTGITPAVKGGNEKTPITYSFSLVGPYSYRLEIDIIGSNLLKLTNLQNTVVSSLINLGDVNFNIPLCSIELNGGGTISEGNTITLVTYYDVISYRKETLS